MGAVLAGLIGFLLGGLGALLLDKAYSGTPLLGKPRACVRCGRPAGVLDALPVLPALRHGGRCPACGARVPWYTAALPPAAAVVAAAGWLTGEATADRALAAAFGLVFLLLAATDLDRRLLPNRITYPGVAAALLASPLWTDRGPAEALLGAVLGFGLMLGPSLLLGGIKAGDIKLSALIGAVLGFPAVLAGLAIGILAGGAAALVLLPLRGRKTWFPYGPFLVAGALAGLWWGSAMVDWYTGS
ncbi:MAG TPA: A24 family peptidase [Dehalococcoidia bacterium]